MKISYTWLTEILPGLHKYPAAEIARKLNLSGLEVESVTDLAARFKGIVAGEVLDVQKHPNADRLNLCRVSTGRESFNVVCGAPNVKQGKKYPFAAPGIVMPDGMEIKPVKIRGEFSQGMLCSGRELQLNGDHQGILELDENAKVGEPFARAMGLEDVILDIAVTPNRGDALSHWGVAREVSVLTGLSVQDQVFLPPGLLSGFKPPREQRATVVLKHKNKKACTRFTVSGISGVKISVSPRWLAQRLESQGLRSINTVVDATNYVMLLTGHPVHAYDARHIADQTITVDTIQSPQKFKTLDGVERGFLPGDLVIGDARGIVGLAGIMGGENSEIKWDTQDVILEAAHFDPVVIRKTAKRLGLQTESSFRFERFVNPDTVLKAHLCLRDLIVYLAGGVPTKILDSYPKKRRTVSLKLSPADVKKILGIDVPQREVVRILKGLGCKVTRQKSSCKVIPPPARSDLTRPVDLIEELARFHGLDRIPTCLPTLRVRHPQETRPSMFEKAVKEFFVANGFSETVHYSFGDPKTFPQALKEMPPDRFVRLENPLSEEMAVLRPSLLPALLSCYLKNYRLRENGLRIFELRNVYSRKDNGTVGEIRQLAGLHSGNPLGRNRFGLARVVDFYDGKGLLASLFNEARISWSEKRDEGWPFHSGQAVSFYVENTLIAKTGALHPLLLQENKIKDRLYYFEIQYDHLAALFQKNIPRYQPVSELPPVYRDLSLVVSKEVTHARLLSCLDEYRPPSLKKIHLFDVYEGDGIPNDMKSLSFSMVYESSQENLTDEGVNQMHFKLVEKLKDVLGARLR